MPSFKNNIYWRYATVTLAVICVYFHLHLIFVGLIPNLTSRPLHLMLALPWVFLFVEHKSHNSFITAFVFCAVGVFACAYVVLNQSSLGDQYGSLEGWFQRGIAVALLLIVLEMARRAVKLALPLVAVVALAYGLFGQHLPGEFGHGGIPFDSFLGTLTIAEGGIWGQLTGVSVNVVAIFVMLGAFLGAGQGGNAFMAMAKRVAGGYRAGAAKVSVVSSALFGSISGSASANVASTGAITLPTMKRLGYPAKLAAAVEAVASSGGQIMPPLMGAGAFVMVELLGVSYTTIMAAALLPAILFFVAAWIGVDQFAKRYDLRAMSAEEIPANEEVLRLAPFFLLPFSLMLCVLFLTSYTPQYAAVVAIFIAIFMLSFSAYYRFSLRDGAERFLNGCVSAARQIAMIASIIICAGIVIGVLHMTGLGIKLTSIIVGFSGGSLIVALLLTAVACLVLGMEVPTTAAYVICISVAGPALQQLGLPALTAHMFVFWYALLSTITPPVCGTVFIASGMAQTPWLPVAGHAMRLGLGLYLIPLAMVANPSLITPGDSILFSLLAAMKIALGLWLISNALIDGSVGVPRRIIFACVGLLAVFWFGV